MAAQKKKVCVAGGAGFIGSHLAKRLKDKENCHVIVVDRKKNEFWKPNEFCDEFMLLDLRSLQNCFKATQGCDEVYNLAADMGGMGYIQSNESVLMFNNTMISSNMLEAARRNGVKRYFYSSSACCYNEKKQLDVDNPGLREADAWPAWPQDTYGLEKLYAEEMTLIYGRDFDITTRVARFHNIYGPYGTWRGGREKAPAAFCRKAAVAEKGSVLEIWGDGKQTRSFCFVDDCVEGILRLMKSDYDKPINIGSDEMISINDLCKLALSFDKKEDFVQLKHIPGPEGVRGRNSENTLIKQVLGWAPEISLADGLNRTYTWIKQQVEQVRSSKDGQKIDLQHSTIVKQDEAELDDFNFDI
eukprot:CAMPEP_0197046802 /NCGR_PEP_ID=MMETSP1384-20130603/22427_1 /TAXON_ID=29189 /ORGANISM="Ammonia sp." /LENGTH=357 /DNA_ID=CAMNT_0042478641 /DNA_START=49 /DNA_END=1122 /DNA_ORIENTATION=-